MTYPLIVVYVIMPVMNLWLTVRCDKLEDRIKKLEQRTGQQEEQEKAK